MKRKSRISQILQDGAAVHLIKNILFKRSVMGQFECSIVVHRSAESSSVSADISMYCFMLQSSEAFAIVTSGAQRQMGKSTQDADMYVTVLPNPESPTYTTVLHAGIQ
jgi:hypothetical protein